MNKIILMLITCYLLASCGSLTTDSESVETEDVFKTYTSLQSFFSQEGVQFQKFTANSSVNIQLTTAKGNKIIFSPNSFVTMDNIPVSGVVTFEVKEITEVEEMVLSNMPTLSDKGILESQGEFFVGVTQNGKNLKLAPNKVMRIEVSGVNPFVTREMKVYNGRLTKDNSILWIQNTSPSNTITSVNASTNPVDSTLFKSVMNSDSLNWVNIDKLIGGPKISHSIYKGNTPSPEETMVFIHYPGRKSHIVYDEFSSTQLIPDYVTLIGLCIHESKIYAAFLPGTLLKDKGSTTLNFEITNAVELKKKLRLLD